MPASWGSRSELVQRGALHIVPDERRRQLDIAARVTRALATRRAEQDRGGGEGGDRDPTRDPPHAARGCELVEVLGHRGEPRLRIAGEPATDRVAHPARNRDGQLSAAIREHRLAKLADRRPGKRALAGQRLPQGQAERELIGRVRHWTAEPLLRCHVRRGAHERAAGHRGIGAERGGGIAGHLAIRLRNPREAEVGDADRAVAVDQHVLRLEVAVHDAGGVRCDQPATGLAQEIDHLGLRAARNGAIERGPDDELHDDVQLTVVEADVIDADHVGMHQLRERLRFAPQPFSASRPRVSVVQDLDRNTATEIGIGGVPHLAHSPRTEPTHEQVTADLGTLVHRMAPRIVVHGLAPRIVRSRGIGHRRGFLRSTRCSRSVFDRIGFPTHRRNHTPATAPGTRGVSTMSRIVRARGTPCQHLNGG